MKEQIEWRDSQQKPDADVTVLIHAPKLDEPVWFGWYDGVSWFLVDGAEIEDEEVRCWAHMPAGPSQQEEQQREALPTVTASRNAD